MNKTQFFAQCDKAAYGKADRGSYDLKIEVCRIPSGAYAVVLRGTFAHTGWKQLYRPKQPDWKKFQEYQTACEAKASKWIRWLNEWKAQQDNPIVEECECCLRPAKFCEVKE